MNKSDIDHRLNCTFNEILSDLILHVGPKNFQGKLRHIKFFPGDAFFVGKRSPWNKTACFYEIGIGKYDLDTKGKFGFGAVGVFIHNRKTRLRSEIEQQISTDCGRINAKFQFLAHQRKNRPAITRHDGLNKEHLFFGRVYNTETEFKKNAREDVVELVKITFPLFQKIL